MKKTGFHVPYIAGVTALVAPTLSASAPNTIAAGGGTAGVLQLTLTGTWPDNPLSPLRLLVDGQMESYCSFVSGTSQTTTIRTTKSVGVHKLTVMDAQGQQSASVNFTIT